MSPDTDTGIDSSVGARGPWESAAEKFLDLEKTPDPLRAMAYPNEFKLDMRIFDGLKEVKDVVAVARSPKEWVLPIDYADGETMLSSEMVTNGKRALGTNPFLGGGTMVSERYQLYEAARAEMRLVDRLVLDIDVQNTLVEHGQLPEHIKSLGILEIGMPTEIQAAKTSVEIAEAASKEVDAALESSRTWAKREAETSRKIEKLEPPKKVEVSGISSSSRKREKFDRAVEASRSEQDEYVTKKYTLYAARAKRRELYARSIATGLQWALINNHVLSEEAQDRKNSEATETLVEKRDKDLNKVWLKLEDVLDKVGKAKHRPEVRHRLDDNAMGGNETRHINRYAEFRSIARDERAQESMFKFLMVLATTRETVHVEDVDMDVLTGDLRDATHEEIVGRLMNIARSLEQFGEQTETDLEKNMKIAIERRVRKLEIVKRGEEHRQKRRG